MLDSQIRYSVIIPVYNSTHSVKELAERLQKVFTGTVKETFEIIFIDDASPDKETWAVLKNLSLSDKNIRAVQLMRNFGKQGAMMCGFEEAKGKFIITMDDDLQHFPEDIPALISEENHDVVIGNFPKKNHSLGKRLLSGINSWFEEKLIGKPKHIKNTPFKMIKAEVIDQIKGIRTPYPYVPALLFFVTRDIVMVDVNHGKRLYNESGFTYGKMYKTFSSLLFNNSSFLLQMVAMTGISISFLSFLAGIFYLIKKLTVGIAVPGWSSLMIVTLFIGGLILFSIGVVGEYLIRIINTIENKPAYLVRKRTGDER
jgi:glycosyltransferase involved in cell wall biosynthesis